MPDNNSDEKNVAVSTEEQEVTEEVFTHPPHFFAQGIYYLLILLVVGGLIWSGITKIPIKIDSHFKFISDNQSALISMPIDGRFVSWKVNPGDNIDKDETVAYIVINDERNIPRQKEIKSGLNGVVISINNSLKAGDNIHAGDFLIEIAQSINATSAQIYVSLKDINNIAANTRIELDPYQYPASSYGYIEAEMTECSATPVSDEQGSYYRCVADVKYPDEGLNPQICRAGVEGNARIILGEVSILKYIFFGG